MDADVERALQHAIGQANSAFATGVPSPDVPTNALRKNKRTRDGAGGESKLPKDKKRKKKNHGRDAPNDVPVSVNEAGLAVHHGETVKTREERKDVKASSIQPHSVSANTGIDLSVLLGDPSFSASPSQTAALISTLTSTSGIHSSANQTAQDLYYPQLLPNFPSFNLEENSLPTNDDILRAFQDLDLTRLAGVLRSLDLPFSPLQPNAQLSDSLQGDANASFLDQMFSTATNIENTSHTTTAPPSAQFSGPNAASGPSNASKKRTKAMKPVPQPNPNLASIGPSIASPEHTHLLANKWLSTSKLKVLVETEGLVYKKGKFSAIEEQALKTAIENYRVGHGLSEEQIVDVIFSKSKENSFWPDITASVPARPITAVYHHVHRAYHPLKLQGKWSEVEDAALIKAVADHGQAWQMASDRVGRTAQDCRDRWKNHLAHRSERQHGHWKREEEEELTRIVAELSAKQGKKNSDNDVFWGVVSERMGNKRSRQQCRIKWTDSLSKTVKNSGNNTRWSKQDSFILVHKVASLDVRDDSEIDWNILPDQDWNLWSAHSMQRRWRALKLSIKGHETMAFREIVEILQQKHSTPQATGDIILTRNSRREPKSAALIEEDEDEDHPLIEQANGVQEDGHVVE